jgi:hypothetical protein
MKVIKIIKYPDKKRNAICVIDDKEPNVVYVIGYIYYNQELFEEALVDSKNFNYVKGE